MINIKIFDVNNIKMDEKSYKNILFYYIGYVTIKESKYVKTYNVNPLYLLQILFSTKGMDTLNKINGNKCLTLVPTNESKEKIKKFEELWSKIRD